MPAPGDRFVGRQRELAQLRAALQAAVDGRGSLTLMAGEPGIGKTRLAEEVAGAAAKLGLEAVWGVCWEGEGAPPYWPWFQVVRGLLANGGTAALRAGGELAAPLHDLVPELRASQAEGTLGAATIPEEARFRLLEAFAAVLGHAAEARPLLVVLEDLHWADHSSLLLLSFLSTRVRSMSLAVVGTYRDLELLPPSASLLQQAGQRGELVMLSGLDREEVAELVEATGDLAGGSAVVSLIHDRSGGNPFFVRELARLLAPAEPDVAAGSLLHAIPQGVQATIARRLARLPHVSHKLLSVAAVVGVGFDVDLLERVTGQNRGEILKLLDPAIRARLLLATDAAAVRYRFAHALVRETLYDAIPLDQRVWMHREVGLALETLVGVEGVVAGERLVDELAHHFLRASAAGEVDRAVHYAERAGHRAVGMLAYEEAAKHFARALAVLPVDDLAGRGRLLLARGDALLGAGDVPQARTCFLQAAETARRRGDSETLARAALGLGSGPTGFEVHMADDEQFGLLEEALERLGKEDSPVRARVLARLSVALSLAPSQERRRRLSEEAITIARRLDDPILAYALASHCDTIAGPAFVKYRLEESTEIITLAQESGDRGMELLGRRLRFMALLERGEIAAVDAEIDAFARTAIALRQPLYRWYVPLWRGMRALMRGHVAEVETWLGEADEIGRRGHSDNAAMLVAVQRYNLRLEQGRFTDAAEIVEAFLEAFRLQFFEPWAALARALVAVRAGRRAEVEALVDALVASGLSTLPVDSEWLPGMCQLAEACEAVGHREAAKQAYELLLPHAELFGVDGIGAACFGCVSRHLGLLAGLLGRWEEAVAHLEVALERNATLDAELLVAHTRRQLAAALRGRGRGGDQALADELLHAAIATYRELGLHHHPAAASGAAGGVSGDAVSPAAPNALRKEGDLWTLAYAGKVVHLKDTKGLRDLARLLAQPGRELSALDLVAGGGAAIGHQRVAAQELDGFGGDLGEVLDATARAAYTARIRELQEEIEEAEANADRARAEQARDEQQTLVAHLAAAHGLGGRPRRAGDPTERARTTATWRIRDAIRRIEQVHPELARHLRHSVRTGTFCSYQPEKTIDWRT